MSITRNEAIAIVSGEKDARRIGIMSATWRARRDKKENRCPYCNDTLARHAQKWVCSEHGVVNANRTTVRRKGDLIARQFIPTVNRNKTTKHWTGVTEENSGKEGHCFNAATKADADAIKARHGLVVVTRMSGDAGDKQGVPITIPVFDIETLTFEGQTHEIVG